MGVAVPGQVSRSSRCGGRLPGPCLNPGGDLEPSASLRKLKLGHWECGDQMDVEEWPSHLLSAFASALRHPGGGEG